MKHEWLTVALITQDELFRNVGALIHQIINEAVPSQLNGPAAADGQKQHIKGQRNK